MLLVPHVRRNLISGLLPVKLGFKIILESNKVVKNNVFVGKGFTDEGLFKLNRFPRHVNNMHSSFFSFLTHTKISFSIHSKENYFSIFFLSSNQAITSKVIFS